MYVSVRTPFPQPGPLLSPSCPTIFSSCPLGIFHLVARVCSLLSFHWEERILIFSVTAFQAECSNSVPLSPSLLQPEQTASPASPPASPAQPPQVLEVLSGLSPVWQGLSPTGGLSVVPGAQVWVLMGSRLPPRAGNAPGSSPACG